MVGLPCLQADRTAAFPAPRGRHHPRGRRPRRLRPGSRHSGDARESAGRITPGPDEPAGDGERGRAPSGLPPAFSRAPVPAEDGTGSVQHGSTLYSRHITAHSPSRVGERSWFQHPVRRTAYRDPSVLDRGRSHETAGTGPLNNPFAWGRVRSRQTARCSLPEQRGAVRDRSGRSPCSTGAGPSPTARGRPARQRRRQPAAHTSSTGTGRPRMPDAARCPERSAALTVAGSSVHVASPARCRTPPTGVASRSWSSGADPTVM
jgi:hypothetical protein